MCLFAPWPPDCIYNSLCLGAPLGIMHPPKLYKPLHSRNPSLPELSSIACPSCPSYSSLVWHEPHIMGLQWSSQHHPIARVNPPEAIDWPHGGSRWSGGLHVFLLPPPTHFPSLPLPPVPPPLTACACGSEVGLMEPQVLCAAPHVTIGPVLLWENRHSLSIVRRGVSSSAVTPLQGFFAVAPLQGLLFPVASPLPSLLIRRCCALSGW